MSTTFPFRIPDGHKHGWKLQKNFLDTVDSSNSNVSLTVNSNNVNPLNLQQTTFITSLQKCEIYLKMNSFLFE